MDNSAELPRLGGPHINSIIATTSFLEFLYTTNLKAAAANVIENLNRVLRKYTKGKTIFPSDEAVQKSIFLAVEHISKKWSIPVANWPLILAQFTILYPDKIQLEL